MASQGTSRRRAPPSDPSLRRATKETPKKNFTSEKEIGRENLRLASPPYSTGVGYSPSIYPGTVQANLEICTLDRCAPCFTAIRAKDGWHAWISAIHSYPMAENWLLTGHASHS